MLQYGHMSTALRKLQTSEFPSSLLQIPEPPETLYLRGSLPDAELKLLCVVGSRKFTSYGKEACEKLISGLRGYPVVIVSGLALGIDAIAHQAALSVGLVTIAVPGSGLHPDYLYPSTNRRLAEKIVEAGGALLSEFEPKHPTYPSNFPQRNRIMAGLSHAVLLIEAETRSGTMITGRLAADYNKELLVVPGQIFSKTSEGPHLFMKLGATPITTSKDILEALHLTPRPPEQGELTLVYEDCSSEEKEILESLIEPKTKDQLIEELGRSVSLLNSALSLLELKGLIREEMGEIRRSTSL